VNCDLACFLIEDYLENRLSRYERQRLERHLASCPHCATELRSQEAFESAMWRGLAAAVHGRRLSAAASQRFIHAAQAARRRAVWSRGAIQAGRAVLGLSAVALVLFGVLFLIGQISSSLPSEFLRSMLRQRTTYPASMVRVPDNALHFEPWPLRPGQPFTITLFLASDQAEPGDAVWLALDITGPTGRYDFTLPVQGPFPAGGLLALEVTPETLAAPCMARFGVAPTEIFSRPGTYLVRAVLYGPPAAQDQ